MLVMPYPTKRHWKVLHLGRLRPYSQTLDLAGKDHLWPIQTLVNYNCKKFWYIGPFAKVCTRNTRLQGFEFIKLFFFVTEVKLERIKFAGELLKWSALPCQTLIIGNVFKEIGWLLSFIYIFGWVARQCC